MDQALVAKVETSNQLSSDPTQCYFNEGREKFTIATELVEIRRKNQLLLWKEDQRNGLGLPEEV